jgi:hypothetical protein
MTRFFALPVLATVLAVVGVRMIAPPAPQPAVDATPAPTPEALLASLVRPQDLWEQSAPPAPEARPTPPAAPPPAPNSEPTVIVLGPSPAPAAPASTVVAERPEAAPQITVIQAPVNNFYPIVEIVSPPAQEGIEVPVAVGIGICLAHRRPGCCLPKPAAVPQDTFFKKTPFQPPTPRHVRFEP